jgi:hypothetical protein
MSVTIPEFDMSVTAAGQNVVSIWEELKSCDGFSMSKDCLDTVPKVKIPKADVLIGTTTHEQGIVG